MRLLPVTGCRMPARSAGALALPDLPASPDRVETVRPAGVVAWPAHEFRSSLLGARGPTLPVHAEVAAARGGTVHVDGTGPPANGARIHIGISEGPMRVL
jgi:hypothetical protein